MALTRFQCAHLLYAVCMSLCAVSVCYATDPPENNIQLHVTASPNPVCVGGTVTFSLTASDSDYSYPGPQCGNNYQELTFPDWPDPLNPPHKQMDVHGQWNGSYEGTCDVVYPNAGVFPVHISADDSGCLNDPQKDWNEDIKVCELSISFPPGGNRNWVEYGCGAYGLSITCSLGIGCPDVDMPIINTTGPLSVDGFPMTGKLGSRSYRIMLRGSDPQGCEQSGTVTARVGDCLSNALSIPAKELPAYTYTPDAMQPTVYYMGERTFADIGESPPLGCFPWDPAYGCITTATGSLCVSGCPPYEDKYYREELYCGDGCEECVLGHEADGYIPAGYLGCASFPDEYGFFTCTCTGDPERWRRSYKIKQQYWIGNCKVSEHCVSIDRDSYTGTCFDFTQTVTVVPTWNWCSCQ